MPPLPRRKTRSTQLSSLRLPSVQSGSSSSEGRGHAPLRRGASRSSHRMASQGVTAAAAQRPRSCCSATRRPRSADRSRPPDSGASPAAAVGDFDDEENRLPALLLPQTRPLSSAVGRGAQPHGNHQGDGRRQRSRSIESQELTLIPLPREEVHKNSSSGQEAKGPNHASGSHSELSAVPNGEDGIPSFPEKKNGTSTSLLSHKVDRLERELESTSDLLRQANRELARREASLAQLGRHNERLRGRVARLESDVAVYRAASSAAASSSSSGEEDATAGAVDGSAAAADLPRSSTRCCSARERELLRTLAGIYDKITRTDARKSAASGDKCDVSSCGKNHRHADAGRSLPEARVLEQVFSNFWQEYRSMSGELEGCKQVMANQELRMRYLEAQVDAANRVKTSDFFKADVIKKDATSGAVGSVGGGGGETCDLVLNGGDACLETVACCTAVANVERRVAEESHLLARLSRLQLDNSRLQVLNREALTREAAVKKELQRVQNKLSSFKTDLARATKKILGRESSCTFPAEVSLRILLEELVSLRRENGRLQMVHQDEVHHRQQQHNHHQQQQQKPKDPAKDTAGGRGLQPVPEESAANGTAADAHPDAAAASVNPSEQCVKNSDGTYTNNGNAIADRRLRRWFSEDATAERHPPDNVPEKEYRIWFPRTEVSDEDPTGRASSDWRTFREYRYTECSRAGRLEKTLSVDEVFNSNDSPRTTAVHPPTSAFHCVSCSNSDEVEGGPLDVAGEERCRMLSSTKSELYREHRSQLLSRLEDDVTSPWEASSLKTDKKPKLSEASADTGSEKEARTSVCQTSSKKFAFDDDNSKTSSSDIPSWNEGGLASAPAPRSLSGNENGSNSHQAVSAGPQDASLVSEDDDFDDSKCTYVKVDSVDSEVEDETGVGRETVIGAPSIDDLGYIAEEPEDDVEETTRDLGNQTSSANTTHEAAESERSCMMSSTAETSHQAPLSSKLGVKEAFKEAGERGNDLKFNESTLDTAVHLATDVNTLVGGKSLECHSDESKSVEQNAKQISHDHNEQKDIVEAALHHGDLSDTETNESDTKSEESVITVKSEATLLPTTRDQSIDEGLADTVTRSANEKENGLDTGETFITGESK
ncbi:uncharacterized protein LOC119444902 [Dermacentor silvarum]|uniref:uncharacterized protein LOC119444902 n=1 Tax=Dermacentor silvarum TaxID=543639 RepID=UPI0021009BE5|nr:uncharacterized protein LOC119444902 [Dermacentor silvarum]